jgi:CRP/FNR family transcriptional regulator, cyclic AMP receptor protein
MINRFLGKAGAAALRQAILEQQCVGNDADVTDALLPKIELLTFKQGEKLIEQGGTDNHIFLILGGRVSIIVNGREMAIRAGRQHVGEMGLIDTSAKRSATIIALEETVVAKIAEPAFSAIANKHPKVWRYLALELGNRLRERSKHVRTACIARQRSSKTKVERLPHSMAIGSWPCSSETIKTRRRRGRSGSVNAPLGIA